MEFGLPGEDPGRLARGHGVATLLAGGMILDLELSRSYSKAKSRSPGRGLGPLADA